MSQRDPVFDSLAFARAHETRQGTIGLASLPRLAASLSDPSGDVAYVITGEIRESRPYLSLRMDCTLLLRCQRCLEAMALPLHETRRFLLVGQEARWPADDEVGGLDDDDCDALEASDRLDLFHLLEDELILSLPIVARHEHCTGSGQENAGKRVSPFAGLAGLKTH